MLGAEQDSAQGQRPTARWREWGTEPIGRSLQRRGAFTLGERCLAAGVVKSGQ